MTGAELAAPVAVVGAGMVAALFVAGLVEGVCRERRRARFERRYRDDLSGAPYTVRGQAGSGRCEIVRESDEEGAQ